MIRNRSQTSAAVATVALLLALFAPAAGWADMNGQDDQQDKEDLQEDVSANNTSFRGARLLKRGEQAYAKDVQALGQDNSATMFWSGDTLNMQVESNHGNRVSLKFEFFWFQAGLDRGSDFYVVVLRGNSAPNISSDCVTVGKEVWHLGVDDDRTKLAQYIDVQADTSGQGGSVRWDWSIPFQTYRWEPKQTINVEQHYALNAGANAEGSVEGSAGMKTADGKEIQGKGSLSANAGAEASHKVSTNYSITLHRWEMQVNSGPSGIKWGLRAMDPKKATDNAYHEYYLVLQSESPGQPVVLPDIKFGGQFECPRKIWFDKGDHVKAEASNIRVSPPPLPDCDKGEVYENGQCVPECGDGKVYENGECKEENDSSGCSRDGDCDGDKICQSGACKAPECEKSPDCESGEICDKHRCRKVECRLDADCDQGEKCDSTGSCVPAASPDTGVGGPDAADAPGRPDGGHSHQPDQNQQAACSSVGTDGGPAGFGVGALFALFAFAGWRGKKKQATGSGDGTVSMVVGVAIVALFATACNGANQKPNILPVDNKTVDVEETLEFEVVAENADSLKAEGLPKDARFDKPEPGEGRFSWSPLISQTGSHTVDFIASNGAGETSTRVQIDVRGGCKGPEIVSSTKWVVDESQQSLQRSIQVKENHCAKEIQWETDGEPDGMTVTPLVHRATVHWEPTEQQWNSEKDEFNFDVTVTNGEGASTTETIAINLGGECPGVPTPAVESTTPSAQQGPNNYPVHAQITAENEIDKALVYYAPKDEPEPGEFQDAEMTRGSSSGDGWTGEVTLEEDLEDGESKTITYRVCAVNSDRSGGERCSVQSCTEHLTFTAQMGTAGGLCKSCSRDGECGGPTDRCVAYGPSTSHCGIDCSETRSCPSGYECTETNGGYEQCVRTVDCGGSGEYRAAESGDLVINEILAHPTEDVSGTGVRSATADQFVEIISTSKDIVDIGKYELQKGTDTRFTFPAGTTVAPGQSVLVFGGGDPANFDDMGTDLVFSARTDRNDVGMLELRRAGDTVRLLNRSGDAVLEQPYGDKSDAMADDIADDGQSITRSPQVQGATWLEHTASPGAGTRKFSPGKSSCGKRFPMEAHGGCGGEHCLGRATDRDVEPNDSRGDAICVSNVPTQTRGTLHYVWREPESPGPDPSDYYELKLDGGDKLTVATHPGSAPEIDNTKLQILSDDGDVLEENLHRHEVRDWYSEIEGFEAPTGGTYYVHVTTPQGKTELEGSYLLSIEETK